jgi:hypothetical protein
MTVHGILFPKLFNINILVRFFAFLTIFRPFGLGGLMFIKLIELKR